jgi:hypothetical protein
MTVSGSVSCGSRKFAIVSWRGVINRNTAKTALMIA